MRAQDPKGGRIVNNGSISSYTPRPGSILYFDQARGDRPNKTASLDGRKHDIAVGQLDVGNASTPMTDRMSKGVPQANGDTMIEPTMDVDNVARAIVYMASLPLDANVQLATVMATKMPYVWTRLVRQKKNAVERPFSYSTILAALAVSRAVDGLNLRFRNCGGGLGCVSLQIIFRRTNIVTRVAQGLLGRCLVDVFDRHGFLRQDGATVVGDFGKTARNKNPVCHRTAFVDDDGAGAHGRWPANAAARHPCRLPHPE